MGRASTIEPALTDPGAGSCRERPMDCCHNRAQLSDRPSVKLLSKKSKRSHSFSVVLLPGGASILKQSSGNVFPVRAMVPTDSRASFQKHIRFLRAARTRRFPLPSTNHSRKVGGEWGRSNRTLSNGDEKDEGVFLATTDVQEVVSINLGWHVEKGTPMEKADSDVFNGRSEYVQGGIKVPKVDGDWDLENVSGRVAEVFEVATEEASQALDLGKIFGVSCGPDEAEIFQSFIEAGISEARSKFPPS